VKRRLKQDTPSSFPLSHWSYTKLVLVDLIVLNRHEVVVLKPQKTNAWEQQPSPMKRSVDQKEQRPNPKRTARDNLHTPTDNVGVEARWGGLYSIFRKSSQPHLSEETNHKKIEKNIKNSADKDQDPPRVHDRKARGGGDSSTGPPRGGIYKSLITHLGLFLVKGYARLWHLVKLANRLGKICTTRPSNPFVFVQKR
jgi:hypothetical protein